MRPAAVALAALAGVLAPQCAAGGSDSGATPATGRIRVVRTMPHDPRAYTQGLLWHRGRLFESLGGYGSSVLREIDPGSGAVLREVRLSDGEFGEGIATVGDRIYQLTWREGTVRRWELPDLAAASALRFEGEGWGLAFDGERLIQSDGTATLTFREPSDFRALGAVRVLREGRPAAYLNELEWAGGSLFANVWYSDEILEIDPASGEVVATYDASVLVDATERAQLDALNGIAWDPDEGLFYLTGKLWPKLFVVELSRD